MVVYMNAIKQQSINTPAPSGQFGHMHYSYRYITEECDAVQGVADADAGWGDLSRGGEGHSIDDGEPAQLDDGVGAEGARSTRRPRRPMTARPRQHACRIGAVVCTHLTGPAIGTQVQLLDCRGGSKNTIDWKLGNRALTC